jgi:FMN reductase
VVAAIAAADAVLLATPTYRASMTGALKNLLDHVPVPALRDTAVGIAAMGASDHHFLGADRHLRDVLTFFGALVTPVTVYLTSRDFENGVPGDRAAAALDGLIATTAALAAAGVRGDVKPLAAR